MITFFTQRAYPLTSLEQELRKFKTIGRPDALPGSERGVTTADRVHMVMTYHPFNTHIKRYLLQNFCFSSTDQQTRDIFPQPPMVAYKRDLSLRDILIHSTDSSSLSSLGHMHDNALGDTPASTSLLSTIYEALVAPSPSAIISPACPKTLCTVYPAADAPISTLVKLGEDSGVE